MKAKKSVFYFPVDVGEQALLLRVREQDLAGRLPELLEMVEQIVEAHLTPAELELAVNLLKESRESEALEARFENLEARLKERIEKGLAEIEGRLSKRLAGDTVPPREPPPPVYPPPNVEPPVDTPPIEPEAIPREASLVFHIGSDVVSGPSAAQFYVAVWKWLFAHGHIKLTELPIQSGKSRYTLAREPVHPSGKKFTHAEQPIEGAFLEVNLSRKDIVRRAKKYLEHYGVSYQVVVGSED